jgi:zinc protease
LQLRDALEGAFRGGTFTEADGCLVSRHAVCAFPLIASSILDRNSCCTILIITAQAASIALMTRGSQKARPYLNFAENTMKKSPFLYSLIVASLLFILQVPQIPVCAAETPAVTRATLGNGLRVVIVRNTLAPVVSTAVNYFVGSNESPEGFPGTAHAQEHMMFRGSDGLSADQLARIIAAMGGNFNADTQQTVTQYFFTVPSEDLEVALRIEAVRMKNVLNTQKLWEKERGAIEQEVAQDLSNPEYLLYAGLLSKLFAGTPYSHDALGTRPSFQKTTATMLRKFHEEWYGPNNAVLVIAGDVEPSATLETVKKLFGPLPRRPAPSHQPIRLQPLKPGFISLETDLSYGLAVIAYRLPGFSSPDFAAGLVLSDVLDSKRGDLYALAAEGKALSAGYNFDPLPETAMGYAVAAFPREGDGQALLTAMRDVISGYLKGGFPSELVDAAKRHEIAGAEFQMNSVEGLAAEWSQAVAVEGRNSPHDDIDAITRVTVEDVNRVAKEYLVNASAVTAILTPGPAGKAVASGARRGRESFAPQRTKPVRLPRWAEVADVLPAVPQAPKKPETFTLSNGLRLIIVPETITGTVSLYGAVKNNADLQSPKGQEGVAEVLSGLFSYGTTTLDRLAFQKEVDDIAANLSVGSSFALQVLSDKFDRGVELLADNLLHPAFPEGAFRIVQRETQDSLAGKLKSPSYLAGRALRSALYPPDDPTLREATPGTVAALTLEDVKSYYHETFRPDMTTIVVIGRIPSEQAKKVIEKYFEDWKAQGPKPQTDLPRVPLNKPSAVAVPDPSRVQVEVTLAETLALTRSDPDYYTLQVGLHVLSGAFYATRLYRDLREKSGLVYAVDAFLDAKKTRSLFGIFYACDPARVSRARSLAKRDITEMQRRPVTSLELKQAKTLLIREITLSRSSVDEIAAGLLALSLEDLPLDEPLRAARHYLDTGASDIKKAFAAWIRPDAFVQMTLGPKPD